MTVWRRRGAGAGACIAVAAAIAAVATIVATPRAADEARRVWAIESPEATTLDALAADARCVVRWVERGLVVYETGVADAPPPAWRSRAIATRAPGWDLVIARGDEAATASSRHRDAISASALLAATAGPLWIGIVPAGRLPADGCHRDSFRAPPRVDPRTVIDTGPPAALAAAAAAARQPLPPHLAALLADVSADTLASHLQMMTRAANGDPADRYVHNTALEAVYAPRVEAAMQRLVQGIAGATVERQTVTLPPDSTYNLVARLPGSVPGSGTFVVSAHLDATGSRDNNWVSDIAAGRPVFTPGAEDNASGVAAVLELLRCLGDGVRGGTLDFAVDLEFIAFSAEEIGLIGSQQFVQRPVTAPRLGCLNLDMVSYDDSLPGYFEIVHNPQSTWLAELVRDATLALPPPHLRPLLEIHEQPVSDHNSFWNVGASGILLEDAPVSTVRRYDTYHRPIDVVERVNVGKLSQVTQAALAALLRFDTGFASAPQIEFGSEDLQLRFQVSTGQFFRYVPGFHHLVPGAPFYARATAHSLGAPFDGALRLRLTETRGGGRVVVLDSLVQASLPTATQFVFLHRIPILAGGGGWHYLDADLTSLANGGVAVTSSGRDSFLVDATPVPELALVVRPNPVRDPNALSFEFPASGLPGQARVEIYDLEGQRVAAIDGVTPQLVSGVYSMRGAAVTQSVVDLKSGAYVARLLWRDAAGGSATATTPLVIVR